MPTNDMLLLHGVQVLRCRSKPCTLQQRSPSPQLAERHKERTAFVRLQCTSPPAHPGTGARFLDDAEYVSLIRTLNADSIERPLILVFTSSLTGRSFLQPCPQIAAPSIDDPTSPISVGLMGKMRPLSVTVSDKLLPHSAMAT